MKPRKPHSKTEPNLNEKSGIDAHGYGKFRKDSHVLEPVVFERRNPYPGDVVIKILYAGICHSDLHYIFNEWSPQILPLVPGHEICGKVIKVGSKVTNFKIGDVVAVGTMVNSCRICSMCKIGKEQYCENGVSGTYDSVDRKPGEIIASGEKTYGGFSSVITVNQDFVFHVPDNLDPAAVAPLLCAGITTYSPLKQFGVKGKRVGVIGIGGLGHVCVRLAKAMGAYVVALTHTKWKLKDAIDNLGADESVLTINKEEMGSLAESLDLIIDTIPQRHDFNKYLELLAYNGTLWILGPFSTLCYDMNILASKNRSIKSSIVGGVPETEELLQFCSNNGIQSDIEKISIDEINETYDKIINSHVRYRFVIDMEKKMVGGARYVFSKFNY